MIQMMWDMRNPQTQVSEWGARVLMILGHVEPPQTQASMKSSTDSCARVQPTFHDRLHVVCTCDFDHPQCLRKTGMDLQMSRNLVLTSGLISKADSQSPRRCSRAFFLKRHSSTRPAWPRRAVLPSSDRTLKFSCTSKPQL